MRASSLNRIWCSRCLNPWKKSAKVFSDDDEDNSNDYVNMFQDNYLSAIADQMVNSGQGLGIATNFTINGEQQSIMQKSKKE